MVSTIATTGGYEWTGERVSSLRDQGKLYVEVVDRSWVRKRQNITWSLEVPCLIAAPRV